MPASSNIGYIGGLDDLRGGAALLVLLYHGRQFIGHQFEFGSPFTPANWGRTWNPFQALLFEGHTAVGLFIVLSGFIFAVGAAGKEVRFVPFLRNRFLRIYPMMLLLTVVGAAIYRGKASFVPMLQTLLLFTDYPGALELGAVGGMFWAVGVEWKCYLLFPSLNRIVLNEGLSYLFGLSFVMILARWADAFLGGDPSYHNAYFTLLGRLDQFGLGMLFGYAHAAGRLTLCRRLLPLSVVLLLAVLTAYNRVGGWPSAHMWKCLWPTLEALLWGLVVAGYVQLSDRWTRPLRPLRWLGIVSYSFYLLHYPFLWTFSTMGWPIRFVADPNIASLLNVVLLLLPAIAAVSVATYWFIERPAMKLRVAYAVPAAAG